MPKQTEDQLQKELIEKHVDSAWEEFSQGSITHGLSAAEYNRRLQAVGRGVQVTCKYVSPEDVKAGKV